MATCSPPEPLLLVQIDHVRQEDPDVETALRTRPGHRAHDVEPGREAVGRSLVEHGVGPARWDAEAHRRQLDVQPRRVERQIHYVALLGHPEAVQLQHDGQREDARVDELKARAGTLLVLGDGRADGLGDCGKAGDTQASAPSATLTRRATRRTSVFHTRAVRMVPHCVIATRSRVPPWLPARSSAAPIGVILTCRWSVRRPAELAPETVW